MTIEFGFYLKDLIKHCGGKFTLNYIYYYSIVYLFNVGNGLTFITSIVKKGHQMMIFEKKKKKKKKLLPSIIIIMKPK